MDIVNESHFAEIEKVLLYVSEARERAERTLRSLEKQDAEPHLVEALEEAERELEAVGRTLMQRTYFAVPKEQLTL
jgi:septation ring formation regulator EzrA